MRSKRKSHKGVGRSQAKNISGPAGKTLKRCKNDVKANVIVIDVDDDDDDDDTADVPESQNHNVRGPSVQRTDRSQIPVVICIDEDDEVSDENQHDISVEEGAEASDSSSSSRCPPPSSHTGNHMDEDDDECQFLHETSPFKFSKCKRTYCAKSPSRNRYGLGPDSDVDLDGEQSDKDQPDSEYMEDRLGELRVLWEKANQIRRNGIKIGKSVNNGQYATSSAQQKVEVEKKKKSGKHTKDQAHLNPGNVCNGSTTSDFAGNETSGCKPTSYEKAPFADSDLNSHKETEASGNNGEQTVDKAKHKDSMSFRKGPACRPSSCSFTENTPKQTHNKCEEADVLRTQHSDDINIGNEAPSTSNNLQREFDNGSSNTADTAHNKCEEADVLRTQHSDDTNIGNEAPSFSNNLQREFDNGGSNTADTANIVCEEPLFQNSKTTSQTRIGDDVMANQSKSLPTGDHFVDEKIAAVLKDLRETGNQCEESVVSVSKESSFENSLPHNEDGTEEWGAWLKEHKEGKLDDEVGDDVDTVQDCLINDREKLKETDEYKRAEEKEWASRQEALRLQAEEAQRARLLLKRKKAESLRVLDMERRQKQRVEEIRKTQKKDQEDMNMKEKLRAEVRIGLKQLEMKSLDMASLLRGLGVHVSGGLKPQRHEIRAAYKKALLSFHPDRAHGSDIRKLVEAEEKFKLISRMKDKFLLT